MQAEAPAAFLSYAHRDDKYEEITRLRERLAHAVSVALGKDFEIFQDRNGIVWGQHWPDRLDEALERAVFLIPILSPSFFESPHCRAELEKFLELEQRAGRKDLILPIYLRTTPAFENRGDSLAAALSRRQYRDWRDLRHKPIESPEVVQRLDQLADEIEAAIRRPAPAGEAGTRAPSPEGIAEGPPVHPPAAEPPPDLEPIEEERRVVRNVALRAAPALGVETVTRLKAGAVVYVAGRARDNGWLRIEGEGDLRGYVVADAVEPLEPPTLKPPGNGEAQRLDQPADRIEPVSQRAPRDETSGLAPPPPPTSDPERIKEASRTAPNTAFTANRPTGGQAGRAKAIPATRAIVLGLTVLAVAGAAVWLAERYVTPTPAPEPSGLNVGVRVVDPPAAARPRAAVRDVRTLEPFRDCDECPEMVALPGGTFLMGSPEGEEGRTDAEGPRHGVSVAPFALGKYEVTFDEWDACVEDGGCAHHPDDGSWGRGRRPVINVSWEDAQQYVAWLSRKTGEAYRLPSEAEWEYAARAGTTTPFWWGDDFAPDKANCDPYIGKTTEVGRYPANPWGLYDTAGNVWEWVEDRYRGDYEGAPKDGSPWLTGTQSARVVRGSAWNGGPRLCRAAVRGRSGPGDRDDVLGFRVARMLTP